MNKVKTAADRACSGARKPTEVDVKTAADRAVYGDMPTHHCEDTRRLCNPVTCRCSPRPPDFTAYLYRRYGDPANWPHNKDYR